MRSGNVSGSGSLCEPVFRVFSTHLLLMLCACLFLVPESICGNSPSASVCMEGTIELQPDRHPDQRGITITFRFADDDEDAEDSLLGNNTEAPSDDWGMPGPTNDWSRNRVPNEDLQVRSSSHLDRSVSLPSILDPAVDNCKDCCEGLLDNESKARSAGTSTSAAVVLVVYSFVLSVSTSSDISKGITILTAYLLVPYTYALYTDELTTASTYPDHHPVYERPAYLIHDRGCGKAENFYLSISWACGNYSQAQSQACGEIEVFTSLTGCNQHEEAINSYLDCMKTLTDPVLFQHTCSSLKFRMTAAGNGCKPFEKKMSKMTFSDGGVRVDSHLHKSFEGFNKMFKFEDIWSTTAMINRGIVVSAGQTIYAESTPFGFVGHLPLCQKYSFFPKFTDTSSTALDEKKVIYFEILTANGSTQIVDSNGEVVPSVTNDIRINKKSCKQSWKPFVTKFKVTKTDPKEMITVEIAPWKGYVVASVDKNDDKIVYISVIYYFALIDSEVAVTTDGLLNLRDLPKDECGCASRDVCYKQDDNIILLGEDDSISHRKLNVRTPIKVDLCNSQNNNAANVSIYTFGCSSEYGLFMSEMVTPSSKGIAYFEKVFLDDNYLYSSGDDKSLTIKKLDDNKSFKPGVYLSDVKELVYGDNNGIGIKDTSYIDTRMGKFSIDRCLQSFHEGGDSDALLLHRCRLDTSSLLLMVKYFLTGVAGVVLALHLVHLILMLYSMRKSQDYMSRSILKAYGLYSCAGVDYKNALEEVCEKSSADLTMAKQLKCYEGFVVNNKFSKLVVRTVAFLPIVSLPVFTVLLILWLIKLIITVVFLPLKIVYGRAFMPSVTFCGWYEFINGPHIMLPMNGPMRFIQKHKKIIRISNNIMRSTATTSTYILLIGLIVLLFLTHFGSADQTSGYSVYINGNCEQGSCDGVLQIGGVLMFSHGFKQTHPLIDSATKAVIGQVEISILNGTMEHELTYQFTNPSFDYEVSRIICKSNDMHFRHKCWGRFHEAEDRSELDCSNWGPQGESFISAAKEDAVKDVYYCDTFGGKGFWWGLSAPSDGLEWIGVKVKPKFGEYGRRQWTTGVQKMTGSAQIKIYVNDEMMLNQIVDIDRLLNSYHFDGTLGTVELSDRRVWGEDISGEVINCEYESLKYSTAPTCRLATKVWGDSQNLNIVGESNSTDEGIIDHNGIAFVRLSSVGEVGSDVRFRSTNEPSKNYYGGSARLESHTSCSSFIERLPSPEKRSQQKCSDRTKKSDKSCTSMREAWANVHSTIPAAKLVLKDCKGVLVDYLFQLSINYRSDSSRIASVDVDEVTIDSSGCYGSNGELRLSLTSSSSESGLVRLSVPNDYVSCPPSAVISSGETVIECSSNVKKFDLILSDPMPNGKSKKVVVNVMDVCKSFEYHEICDDCSKGMPMNRREIMTWQEIVIITFSCLGALILLVIILYYMIPSVARTATLSKVMKQNDKRIVIERENSDGLRRRLIEKLTDSNA